MKSFFPVFAILFSMGFADAACPELVNGMESESELSRIEAAADFSVCSSSELDQVEERVIKQVSLFCPAGIKSLVALDSKNKKDLGSDDIRTMLSCASRKATLSLIRIQRAHLTSVRKATKDL